MIAYTRIRTGAFAVVLAVLVALASGCRVRPRKIRTPPPPERKAKIEAQARTAEPRRRRRVSALNKLARQVGARVSPVENPCIEGDEDNCFRRAMDRVFVRLDALLDAPRRSVRILQLGDSHIAADYITGTIRKRLQSRFGAGGRGYVHVEQRAQYGGRRLGRSGPWTRTRIVDKGQSGKAFGFSGMQIESRGSGARVDYALRDDGRVTIFFQAHPQGPEIRVSAGGETIGRFRTRSGTVRAQHKTFTLPKRKSSNGGDKRVLRLTAGGRGARLWGLSFLTNQRGIVYDSVGPVGADAAVYLSLDEAALSQQLRLLAPDLVVIMVGGNDGLRLRKRQTTLQQIRLEHELLVERIQEALPDADCMLWSPMDAGVRKNGAIVSKTLTDQIRDVQRDVAHQLGCGFWDMYAAMGEKGAIARWSKADIINKDLVHPRQKAGELLGHLFATSLMDAYDAIDD